MTAPALTRKPTAYQRAASPTSRAARADRGRDYVVATGVSHSVRDFVEAAFRAAGVDDWERRVTLDPRFARPNDAPELVGDATRARELLGWEPRRRGPLPRGVDIAGVRAAFPGWRVEDAGPTGGSALLYYPNRGVCNSCHWAGR